MRGTFSVSGPLQSQKNCTLASEIVAEAASWEGTPYRWRAATRNIGADCGSYIHGVLGTFYTLPPLPDKRRESWVTEPGGDYWEQYLSRVADKIDDPLVGCGVLFKYGHNFCHGGIVDEAGHIWHCWGRKGLAGVSRSSQGFFMEYGRLREHFFWRVRDELLRT